MDFCQKLMRYLMIMARGYFGYKIDSPAPPEKIDAIRQALLFWKFVKNNLKTDDWLERQEKLKPFTEARNYYISAIAMLECLPDSVMRRVLWRHNIFFRDLQGFLEKLRDKDYKAIRENFQDLRAGRTPRVIRWWERVFKKMTRENLLKENYNSLVRNQSKESWSINLAGLDFGFNSLIEVKEGEFIRFEAENWKDYVRESRKFLAIENGEKNFVVNTEFGLYFWFYRTARSSYGWMRNRVVHLKRNICPGFWWTFIVHGAFWLASPICLAILLATNANEINSWWKTIFYVTLIPIALVMPLWILSALTWSGFRLILSDTIRQNASDLIDRADEKLDSIKDEYSNFFTKFKLIRKGLMIAFILAILTIMLFSLVGYLTIFFVIFGSAWFLWVYVFDSDNFHATVWQKRTAWMLASSIPPAGFIHHYEFFRPYVEIMLFILSEFRILLTVLGALILAGVAMIKAIQKMPDNKNASKSWDICVDIFQKTMPYALLAIIGFIVYSAFNNQVWLALILGAYLLAIPGLYYYLIISLPEIHDYEDASDRINNMYFFKFTLGNNIKKNKNFYRLDQKQKIKFISTATRLAIYILDRKRYRKFFKTALAQASLKDLEYLLENIHRFYGRSDKEFFLIIKKYFLKKDLEKAIAAAEAKSHKREKTIDFLLMPIRFAEHVYDFFSGKFGPILWIREVMKKMCPIITHSKYLDINEIKMP
jgi:hypothetical protein